MEKKNVIFLSVIAVATLLTAVIGTTLACFTATVTDSGNNNTASSLTSTVTSASMEYGSTATNSSALPGHKDVKTLTITASAPASNVSGVTIVPVETLITIEPIIPTELSGKVIWKLYSTDATVNAVSGAVNGMCTYERKAQNYSDGLEEGQTAVIFYEESNCPKADSTWKLVASSDSNDSFDSSAVKTEGSKTTYSKKVTATAGTSSNKYYYVLVVEYLNDGNQSTSQEGKHYSVSLSYTVDSSKYLDEVKGA